MGEFLIDYRDRYFYFIMILTLGFTFALFGSAFSYEGLILGGYGATNFIQLVGTDHVCMGEDITPPIPQVLPAANPTWVAEYVDGTIYLCGGQNLDQRRDCYSYTPGQDAKFTKASPMTEDRRLPASWYMKMKCTSWEVITMLPDGETLWNTSLR